MFILRAGPAWAPPNICIYAYIQIYRDIYCICSYDVRGPLGPRKTSEHTHIFRYIAIYTAYVHMTCGARLGPAKHLNICIYIQI